MSEQDSLNQDQMNELLFMQVVMMFQGMAQQHLGKVMNPATQKVERNLEQAKFAIDTLGMLEGKTQGNLGDNEKQMLEHALFELRMNYVDELKKGPDSDSESATDGESDEPGGTSEGGEEKAEEAAEPAAEAESESESEEKSE